MTKSVIETDRVELHTTLASDLLYAVMGTALSAGVLVGLAQAGGNILVFVHDAGTAGRRFGPLVTSALILSVIPMAGMWMIGGWMRVFDPAPAIVATSTGLSFNPAFGPRNTPWNLVETMELDDRQMAVRLSTRIWSPWVWLSGRTISPYFKELGLDEAKARDAIAAMRALKARSGGPEWGEPCSPTADDKPAERSSITPMPTP